MSEPLQDLVNIAVVDRRAGDYSELASTANPTDAAPGRFRFYSDGHEALRDNPQDEPQLWVINTDLPDMAGIDLYGLLRYRGSSAPVVLVSDNYSIENEITARGSGATLYFTKPLQRQWLSAALQSSNFRRLKCYQNVIERAVVFTKGDTIGSDAFSEMVGFTGDGYGITLPNELLDDSPGQPPIVKPLEANPLGSPAIEPATEIGGHETGGNEPDKRWPNLATIEENHIRQTLDATHYNQSAAARLLDIDRKLLARKIKKYGIEIPSRDRSGS